MLLSIFVPFLLDFLIKPVNFMRNTLVIDKQDECTLIIYISLFILANIS